MVMRMSLKVNQGVNFYRQETNHKKCGNLYSVKVSMVMVCTLNAGSQYDAGTTSIASIVSDKGKTIFFTSQILFLMLQVGHWLMLATQRWNRNQVYSSVTPTLAMLRWCEHHIVYQPLLGCTHANMKINTSSSNIDSRTTHLVSFI